MAMMLEEYWHERRSEIDRALRQYLEGCREPLSDTLFEAIAYALEGGKRLRPILVLAGAELLGQNPEQVIPTALAFELFHTYSLIHDDLPCMDDDDLRRGRPTTHKKFGEAVAVLAGDSLIPMGFSLIAREQLRLRPAEQVLRVLKLVATTLGPGGLTGGQLLDLVQQGRIAHPRANSLALEPEEVSRRKTANLLASAAEGGAILAEGTPEECAALRQYGERLGLAYQVVDDFLDEGISKGVPLAAQRHTETAIGVLSAFGSQADILRDLARALLARRS